MNKLKIIAIVIGLLTILASIAVWYAMLIREDNHIKTSVDAKASSVTSAIKNHIAGNIQALDRMAMRWQASKQTPQSLWEQDAKQYINHNSSILNISWIDANGKARWSVYAAQTKDKKLISQYNTYITLARDSKKTILSHAIDSAGNEKLLLAFSPLFIDNQFDGTLVETYSINNLIKPATASSRKHGFYTYIFENNKTIYQNTNIPIDRSSKLLIQKTLKIYNLAWRIIIVPSPGVIKMVNPFHFSAYMVLGIGIIMGFLLMLAIYVTAINKERSKKINDNLLQLNLIHQSLEIVTNAQTFKASMHGCINLVCAITGWPIGHAYIVNKDKTLIESTNLWYDKQDPKFDKFKQTTEKINLKLGEGLPGTVWQEKKPVWLEEIADTDHFYRSEICEELEIVEAVAFPIIVQNEVIGVLEFFRNEEIDKDENLLQTFSILGQQIGQVWEKRRAAIKSHDAEEHTRLLLQSAAEGIYGLDKEGKTTFVNPAVERLLGYSSKELIGKKIHGIIHHSYADGKPYPVNKCPTTAALADGSIHHVIDEVFWKKDGTPLPIEYTSTPIRRKGRIIGTVVTFSDISKQVEAAKHRDEDRKRMHTLIENVQYGVLLEDENHRIMYINKKLCDMFKLDIDPNKLVGLESINLIEKIKNLVNMPNIFVDETKRITANKKFKENEEIHLVDTGTWDRDFIPIRVNNELYGYLWQYRDISDRKKMENLKSDFVSLISHQLKTPIAEVSGYIDNMLSGITGDLNERQKEYLQDMQKISRRNYMLISDLLNVSRIERGVISIEPEPVNLYKIAIEASAEYSEDAKQKNLDLTVMEDNQLVNAFAEKDKLLEVVKNLIDNAIKYTEEGSITLSVDENEQWGLIMVTDTGVGIEPKLLDTIFQKDQPLSGRAEAGHGCGLGLFIANNFMSLQKGGITVESTAGVGTTFTIKVPKKGL